MADNKRTCTFDGCEQPHEAHGYCQGHYKQLRRGRPLTPLRIVSRHGMTLSERIEMHRARPGDCWPWTACRNSDGYGQISVNGALTSPHRVAYELANGPIPAGMMIDHKCHTPSCVRPDHLRVASRKQNGENRAGATANSKSGVRGVSWNKARAKWEGQVGHNRQNVHVGLFATIEEAEAAVIAKRNELFTHSDADWN